MRLTLYFYAEESKNAAPQFKFQGPNAFQVLEGGSVILAAELEEFHEDYEITW